MTPYFVTTSPLDAMRAAMAHLEVEDPMTVAHTLKGGIDALEMRGWTQRCLIDPVGHVCAVGAVVVTAEPTLTETTLHTNGVLMADPVIAAGVMALAATLGWTAQPYPGISDPFILPDQHEEEQRHSAFVHVTSWNDEITLVTDGSQDDVFRSYITSARVVAFRTVDQVKDLFRRAIALLEVL